MRSWPERATVVQLPQRMADTEEAVPVGRAGGRSLPAVGWSDTCWCCIHEGGSEE